MLAIREKSGNRVVVDASGRLDREDYERIVPVLEETIREAGSLRMLVRLHDFHGWTPKALADDLRFDVRHHDDFRRVAVVGEKHLEKLGTMLSKPIFSGDVKYFEDEPQATAWLDDAT